MDQPGHGDFILSNGGAFDWRSVANNNLWQGVSGVNNPCPLGYRLPTRVELFAQRLSWISPDAAWAFNSPLRLTLPGLRESFTGTIYEIGIEGRYWSSTVDGVDANFLYLNGGSSFINNGSRADAFSVRCIKYPEP